MALWHHILFVAAFLTAQIHATLFEDMDSIRGLRMIGTTFNESDILKNVNNPFVGGNMIDINGSGCTIASVFESKTCDGGVCEVVGKSNGHCYKLEYHEYKQWEEKRKDNFAPVLVKDNCNRVIGEIIHSVVSEDLDALIFSIYDQDQGREALHQVATLGDISHYSYLHLKDISEFRALKELGGTPFRVGGPTGVVHFILLDECERIKEWRLHVRILEQADGRLRQQNNLYCYDFIDEGQRGDCGAFSAVNTTRGPIVLGLQVGMIVSKKSLSDHPFASIGYFQDIETYFDVLNIKNPFKKISLTGNPQTDEMEKIPKIPKIHKIEQIATTKVLNIHKQLIENEHTELEIQEWTDVILSVLTLCVIGLCIVMAVTQKKRKMGCNCFC